MTVTVHWDATLTAISSVAHGGETLGNTTFLRREIIEQPDGTRAEVPIISGNGFKARLRRTAERLAREVLQYDTEISRAAAHALRGGGSLAKTPAGTISPARLRALRDRVPLLSVFGFSGGGRINESSLAVGKIVPHLLETHHILPTAVDDSRLPSAFTAPQLESYTRRDDTYEHDFVPTSPAITDDHPEAPAPDQNMVYRIETLPAGTRFSTWLRLTHASLLEVAFFDDVLAAWAADARIGGRVGIGHGQVRFEASRRILAGDEQPVDWRAELASNRAAAIEALSWIT